MGIPKIIVPTIVGITVYILVSKLFPQRELEINPIKNGQKNVRGGDVDKYRLFNLFKEIVQKIMKDRSLKIAIISVFATAGFQYFNEEIKQLLINDVYLQVCDKEVKGQLKVICDIIKEHEIDLHTTSMRELIISNSISNEDKINLLKIKLDFIINGDYLGKKRFVILSIIALLMIAFLSGVGGLAIFLEALYRLFQEGKISKAVYEQVMEIIK